MYDFAYHKASSVADAAATEGGASGLFAGRISGLNFPAWDGGFFGGISLTSSFGCKLRSKRTYRGPGEGYLPQTPWNSQTSIASTRTGSTS
jgi:hypothetical protein